MKRVILLTFVALHGCTGGQGDAKVCTPIFDPPGANSIEEGIAKQRDPDWLRVRAEACVHRQAYRLATSPDPATIVAKAVAIYCEGPIGGAAATNAHSEIKPLADDRATQEEMDWVAERELAIRASFEQLALSKVVEGRAGKCRP